MVAAASLKTLAFAAKGINNESRVIIKSFLTIKIILI